VRSDREAGEETEEKQFGMQPVKPVKNMKVLSSFPLRASPASFFD